MNTKILMSLATIGLVSSAMGYGTYAFFSDTETSTGNVFSAGSLDLTLNGLDGVTGTIGATNFAPGDSVTGSILLRNEGTITTGDAEGHTVDLDLKALTTVFDDQGGNDTDDGGASAIPMDRYLVLTTFTYGGSDLLALIGDADGDGRNNTLADLEAAGALQDLADPGAGGKSLELEVLFVTDAGNDLKRDRVDLDFTFYLSQAGDADLS